MSAPATTLIDRAVARWSDPASRPLFKGSLVDSEGCMCAQGDILHHELGWSIDRLRDTEQAAADAAIAASLGISRAHAILLRNVNDRLDGAPRIVLTDPEKVIGDQATTILAFWRHLDRMTADHWAAARAAAGAAAGAAAWAATGEIMGARVLREQGRALFFLPLFGFADPEAILAAEVSA